MHQRQINHQKFSLCKNQVIHFHYLSQSATSKLGNLLQRALELKKSRALYDSFLGRRQNLAKRMKVILYQPFMRAGVIDKPNSNTQRYVNCMVASQELSCEGHNWIEKKSTVFSWVVESPRNRVGELQVRMYIVQRLQMVNEISISFTKKISFSQIDVHAIKGHGEFTFGRRCRCKYIGNASMQMMQVGRYCVLSMEQEISLIVWLDRGRLYTRCAKVF